MQSAFGLIIMLCFAGKILLTEFFNHDDLLGVTSVNSRPLFPCYEAEDLIRPWRTFFYPRRLGRIWFEPRGIEGERADVHENLRQLESR